MGLYTRWVRVHLLFDKTEEAVTPGLFFDVLAPVAVVIFGGAPDNARGAKIHKACWWWSVESSAFGEGRQWRRLAGRRANV
jgi:hypothetical protein